MIPVKKTKKKVAESDFVKGKFNHKNVDSDTAACGFDGAAFKEKNVTLNDMVATINDQENFVSQLAESFEKKFLPREITYMAAKMAYINMIQEFDRQGGNRAGTKEES